MTSRTVPCPVHIMSSMVSLSVIDGGARVSYSGWELVCKGFILGNLGSLNLGWWLSGPAVCRDEKFLVFSRLSISLTCDHIGHVPTHRCFVLPDFLEVQCTHIHK